MFESVKMENGSCSIVLFLVGDEALIMALLESRKEGGI